MSEALQPLWFKLPKRFYRKLALVAEAVGMEPEGALEFALELFGEFSVAAQKQGVTVKQFVTQLRPRIRAWQKEAEQQRAPFIEALEDGAKLYHMYGPLAAHGARAENVRKSPSTLAILRWANVPAADRSEQARQLAKKRW